MQYRGQVVQDRYEVGEWIGQGGASTVYQAHDLRLDRVVAIKFLRPELRADSTFVTRFEREARSAAQLSHPNIVPIFDYGEVAGTFFIVMELIHGGDLQDRLNAAPPLSVQEAVRIAAEVAEGLGAAHAVGIVHRDVKPGNILLTRDGHAKITDFGIVKMVGVPKVTTVSISLGTPHYAAPEQTSGGAITPATDVYGLGIVLFEMLAGRPPFEGSSLIEVAMQHLQAAPPALAELNHAVPPELQAIVERAMAKEPSDRFPDGSAFAAALREQEHRLAGGDALVAATPVVADAESATPPPDRIRAVGRPNPRPRAAEFGGARHDSRSRALVFIAGLIFIAFGIALLATIGNPGRRGDAAPSEFAGATTDRTPVPTSEIPGITIVDPTSEATTTVSGAAAASAPTSAPAAGPTQAAAASASQRRTVSLDDDAFIGGFSSPRDYRGRTARWVYGAFSPYGSMTAFFTLTGSPGAGELLVKGIDSEGGAPTQMEIRVNDIAIFKGGNPLPKETWQGNVAPWSEATFAIPEGVLKNGLNTVTINNLAPVDNYNSAPYVMVDEVAISY